MTISILLYMVSAAGGYLIGSIPVGLMIARMRGISDLRKTGSGNIGATNVLRAVGPASALATMLIDGGKAALVYGAVLWTAGQNHALIAGFMAVFGHCYPVWLRFNGGKGASSGCGLVIAMAWPVGLSIFALWTCVILITSYVSLGAILAVMALPFIAWGFGADLAKILVMIALGVLTLIRHVPNIQNLTRGNERRLSIWRR